MAIPFFFFSAFAMWAGAISLWLFFEFEILPSIAISLTASTALFFAALILSRLLSAFSRPSGTPPQSGRALPLARRN
ncbi:hypothetical protein [Leisingera sp. ANG-M7]|uniref:hypothetical protein n=1 Tax=Leisingera sp. ANG-M7 TaxID=1577902 RepID=UPI00057F4C45|nr:hypothetical protein [Leisingera sp. ANG-M7]KIC35667.1 hypothetical protein RA26_16590 [Leisingera sp. ANG-M7]